MAGARIAAVTHARKDDYFLQLWLDHYGAELGHENCFVLLDGADWTPEVDWRDATALVLDRPRAAMHRIRVDRRMARQQIELIDRLLLSEGYDFVFRGDCDEYVLPDPERAASLADVAWEAEATGFVYSLGIDVIHNPRLEPPADLSRDLLSQRGHGLVYQSYCKVNLLSRKAREVGITFNAGGHRASGAGVPVAETFVMAHLGWADRDLVRTRIAPRYVEDRELSFTEYLDARLAIFDHMAGLKEFADFDEICPLVKEDLSTQGGAPAVRTQHLRRGNTDWGGQTAWAVRLPKRFALSGRGRSQG